MDTTTAFKGYFDQHHQKGRGKQKLEKVKQRLWNCVVYRCTGSNLRYKIMLVQLKCMF